MDIRAGAALARGTKFINYGTTRWIDNTEDDDYG